MPGAAVHRRRTRVTGYNEWFGASAETIHTHAVRDFDTPVPRPPAESGASGADFRLRLRGDRTVCDPLALRLPRCGSRHAAWAVVARDRPRATRHPCSDLRGLR